MNIHELLLLHDIDINKTSEYGITALHDAVYYNEKVESVFVDEISRRQLFN